METNIASNSSENLVIFEDLDKDNQFNYIVKLLHCNIGSNDFMYVESLITTYELLNGVVFNFEFNRYMYSYLKYVTMQQAIHLYDSLSFDNRNVIIDVIKIDHPHLLEMVEIHDCLKLNDTLTESDLFS